MFARLTPDLRRDIFRFCNTGLARAQIWIAGRREQDTCLLDAQHGEDVCDAALVSRSAAQWFVRCTEGKEPGITTWCRAAEHTHNMSVMRDYYAKMRTDPQSVRAFRSLYGSRHGCRCINHIVLGYVIKQHDIPLRVAYVSALSLARMPLSRLNRWREWLARH